MLRPHEIWAVVVFLAMQVPEGDTGTLPFVACVGACLTLLSQAPAFRHPETLLRQETESPSRSGGDAASES